MTTTDCASKVTVATISNDLTTMAVISIDTKQGGQALDLFVAYSVMR